MEGQRSAYLRRVKGVQDERDGYQADQARDESSEGPCAPRDGDAGGERQVDGQRVGSHGCGPREREPGRWEGGRDSLTGCA